MIFFFLLEATDIKIIFIKFIVEFWHWISSFFKLFYIVLLLSPITKSIKVVLSFHQKKKCLNHYELFFTVVCDNVVSLFYFWAKADRITVFIYFSSSKSCFWSERINFYHGYVFKCWLQELFAMFSAIVKVFQFWYFLFLQFLKWFDTKRKIKKY